jgi:membrane associated rhomboid family serine protease
LQAPNAVIGPSFFPDDSPKKCAHRAAMSWLPESQDRLPLTWWKGEPVYLAAVLALGGVASMIVTAVIMAADGAMLSRLVFSFANVVDNGRIWTPLTYVLVNPPSIWLVLGSYFLWRFGEQVERHLGRRVFVKLVCGLVLVTPLLLSLVALVGIREWAAAGIWQMEFGVFLAFATLYPRAKLSIIIATIDAWVMAAILVGISELGDLAARNWPGLFVLAGQVLFAHGYMRYEQGRWTLPDFAFLKRRPRLHVVRGDDAPRQKERGSKTRGPGGHEQVDAILEKIHREGLQSLTEEERRVMEQASESLRKRGS